MTYYSRGNLGQLNTNKTPEETRRDIEEVFRKWNIEEYRLPPSKGVRGEAVTYFWVNDEKHELKCSRFDTYRQNLRAIYLILDELRLAHERGILSELAAAAVAFLPPSQAQVRKRPWFEVLQVAPNADAEVVEASYRALAKQRHPDVGGSNEAMLELNDALSEYKRLAGVA